MFYRCRQADSALKQSQLKTGGGPPLPDDPDELFFEKVRIIAPKIDFTLENPWDNTGEFEGKKFYSTFYITSASQ